MALHVGENINEDFSVIMITVFSSIQFVYLYKFT